MILERTPVSGGGADGQGDAGAPGAPGTGGSVAGPGGAGATDETCPPFASGLDLAVCRLSRVSTTGTDRYEGVAITSSGAVVSGGDFDASPLDQPLGTAFGAEGGAALLRSAHPALAPSGGVWIDGDFVAVGAHPIEDVVFVVTDERLLALEGDLSDLRWEVPLPEPGERLSVGEAGGVAVLLVSGDVLVFSAGGDELGSFAVMAPEANDLAYSDALERVFVVGSTSDPSGACSGTQPFLRAYDLSGELVWKAWDFPSVEDLCAASVGRRVSLGRNGALYYAGHNQGGNTVHTRGPTDVTVGAPVVAYDDYSQGYGMAIQRYGFVARFDPETGNMATGIRILPRTETNVGGELLIDAIEADMNGNVLLGARQTCCGERRDERSVNGEEVGPYVEAEAAVIALRSDFLERLSWAPLTRTSIGPSRIADLALNDDFFAAVGETEQGTELLSTEPGSTTTGGVDGFLLTVSAP